MGLWEKYKNFERYWEKHKILIYIYGFTLLMLGLIAYDVIVPDAGDIYNTTEMQVIEAVITSTTIDSDNDDNYYCINLSIPAISRSDLTAEVTSDFYFQAAPGQKVGVLVGQVETYHARPSLNRKQLKMKYVSKNWEVLSVYPSLADAQQENQLKTFTTNASLKQRIKSLDGRYFFLFNAGGKKVMAEVSSAYYQKYRPDNTPSDLFELEFAGNGDFNRLVRIVQPEA